MPLRGSARLHRIEHDDARRIAHEIGLERTGRQVHGRAGCIRHRDALHRDQRRERQQHRPAGGPAFEHHAPLLLDQDPPRGRLDGQAGGPDEARDQLVLRAVVLVDT